MNDVIAFGCQIRDAFQRSGPIPIFAVSSSSEGYKVTQIKRIRTEIVPQVFDPKINPKKLSDSGIQEEINDFLSSNPICNNGVDDLVFKLKTGKYAVVRNVCWSYEIYQINRMEMSLNGTIGLLDYSFHQTIN